MIQFGRAQLFLDLVILLVAAFWDFSCGFWLDLSVGRFSCALSCTFGYAFWFSLATLLAILLSYAPQLYFLVILFFYWCDLAKETEGATHSSSRGRLCPSSASASSGAQIPVKSLSEVAWWSRLVKPLIEAYRFRLPVGSLRKRNFSVAECFHSITSHSSRDATIEL